MYTETYPITTFAERKINFNDISVTNSATNSFTFLYIGNNADHLQYFSNNFKKGIFTSTLAEAIKFIDSLIENNEKSPDAIVFDIPLNKNQYADFCKYLDQNKLFSITPLVYNETSLDAEDIAFLRKNKLIDDVINIHSWGVNYAKRISFLKKIKKHPRPLKISKSFIDSSAKQFGKPKFACKRCFDIIISLFVLLLSLPVLVLIALAIKLESKGPVFYTSLRAGRGFKIFQFFKFRTMEIDADKKIEELSYLNHYGNCENGVKFLKIYNDPRVTKVGRFLRKTSLDELPQLFNVLKGDMSLVGNRPLPIYEATTLTTNDFVERFMAPAGITGLWQIKKKENPDMSAEERVNLDISYARNYSLLYDFKIIARTPAALFQKNDA